MFVQHCHHGEGSFALDGVVDMFAIFARIDQSFLAKHSQLLGKSRLFYAGQCFKLIDIFLAVGVQAQQKK